MPSRLVTDADLLDRLSRVFRTVGYDGASLTGIAAATGLQKSSLYHRFPGGKEQMAAEVAAEVGRTFASDVLAPLGDPSTTPHARLAAVIRNLEAFYDRGALSCLLDVLSIGDAGPATSAALDDAARAWIAAFASIARSSGLPGPAATVRAQDAIAAIEGALVLARVTGDRRPFARAVRRLPQILLDPQDQ